jgi:hypothetical protein
MTNAERMCGTRAVLGAQHDDPVRQLLVAAFPRQVEGVRALCAAA